MKRFLLLVAAFAAVTLHAGTAADSGNLAAALQETDPVERLGALFHALDVAGETSPELIRCLNEELKKSGCDEKIKKRLLEIGHKRSADIRCADLVMSWCIANDGKNDALVKLLETSLRNFDLSKAERELYRVYFRVLNMEISMRLKRYEAAEAGDLMKYLTGRYPDDPQIAALAAEVYVLACFLDTDTAPGLRNWEDLSDKNQWKSELVKLQDRAGDMAVKDRDDAVALSRLAFSLRDRDLLEKAVEIRRRVPVPDNDPAASVTGFAVVMKMPELPEYIHEDLKVYILAGAGDLKGAEKAMKKSSGAARMREYLFLLNVKKDFQTIRDLIISGKAVPDSRVMFFAGCEAAIRLHDTKLLDKLIAIVGKQNLRAEIANLFGYSCVLLDHRLADAEMWLKEAVKKEPRNSSYLDSYAWLLFRRGEYMKAREVIGEALKNREPDASAAVLLLHAAEIELAATGDKAAARHYLARAEKLGTPEVSDWREEDVKRVKELLK